ncbi:ABC transporter ATP-binding protein [Oceanobacillus sp. Castelsardo]|uniref:ABC transporter ATP-binding protein n=1 Tax=Oceanobacillus sp. Castelsardo TaxID=1851204 RepID=UPI000837CD7A|nr:ABC transporter ATP-binding protein [Oceanobacillus sp. Castelsardo]
MLVTVQYVSKQFKKHTAVHPISFSIGKGRCIALLGPNGAGKTTTLQMLAGLLKPTSGTIEFVGNKQIDNRSQIGFLPQHPTFFNWMTAQEFLQFAGELSHVPKKQLAIRLKETLAFVRLEDVRNKKIGGFSGGMKQRLGLAQALLHEPELLILDEPVSALDPTGRRDVLQLLDQLKSNMTILFSTHILHDAEQVCEDILMLKDGRLKWSGTLEGLKKEYNSLAIKLQTKEPINGALDQLDFMEEIEYVDSFTVKVRLKSLANSNQLVQTLIENKRTLAHFELLQDSLEDAFMKVMER